MRLGCSFFFELDFTFVGVAFLLVTLPVSMSKTGMARPVIFTGVDLFVVEGWYTEPLASLERLIT